LLWDSKVTNWLRFLPSKNFSSWSDQDSICHMWSNS